MLWFRGQVALVTSQCLNTLFSRVILIFPYVLALGSDTWSLFQMKHNLNVNLKTEIYEKSSWKSEAYYLKAKDFSEHVPHLIVSLEI